MKNLIYIFIGGGLGSASRYLVSSYTQKIWNAGSFPVGTFLVNITGCLLIGFFTSCFLKSENHLKYLLISGFCGGYTTFSAFSVENYSLWQNQQYGILLLYVILSIIIGFGGVILGMKMYSLI